MPKAAKRPCRHPGCPELVDRGWCERHSRDHRREADQRRGSSTQRGYDYAWQKASRAHLAEHPLCVDCLAKGLTVAATVVDHERPHKGNPRIFWDQAWWRSRCKPCHDAKTAREDGGFGNPTADGGRVGGGSIPTASNA